MLVTDRRRTRGRDLATLVGEAVRGGVRLVQVREKDLQDDELRAVVQQIRAAAGSKVILVVNGSLRVARTQRTGLHLAAAAWSPGNLELRGQPFGRSVHDDEELRRAVDEGVDYVVAGTIFRSAGKPGRAPGGLPLLERIFRQAQPLPVFAIGGVGVGQIPPLLHSGAHGVAVCGAILSDNDPRRVAEAMTLAIEVVAAARSATLR
jgi:thiamine-phosphate pyrophosphorylase